MTEPNDSPKAPQSGPSTAKGGGIFLAILPLVGVFVGGFLHQPTIGLLAGLALGAAIAIGMFLKDRNS